MVKIGLLFQKDKVKMEAHHSRVGRNTTFKGVKLNVL